MSTRAIQHLIADVLVPFGVTGAVIAVAAALIAGAAFALRGAGAGGVASAVWVVGVILSSAAGYGGEWLPLAVALSPAPVGAVVVGIRRLVALLPTSPAAPPVDTAATPLPA